MLPLGRCRLMLSEKLRDRRIRWILDMLVVRFLARESNTLEACIKWKRERETE